eukprot:TRINITY_DN44220_c0_g1_i1.p1 TRINITY_DN44220_c0_g1~~TRINITY_DN44220_c0_g1_i1.p1  ORF type:complete len:244 (-),score=37.28 TRINITY_DN44220_c0_g1_i1:144-875(-)
MIRRPPRSTLSSSSAASDVYKRQRLSRLLETLSVLRRQHMSSDTTHLALVASLLPEGEGNMLSALCPPTEQDAPAAEDVAVEVDEVVPVAVRSGQEEMVMPLQANDISVPNIQPLEGTQLVLRRPNTAEKIRRRTARLVGELQEIERYRTLRTVGSNTAPRPPHPPSNSTMPTAAPRAGLFSQTMAETQMSSMGGGSLMAPPHSADGAKKSSTKGDGGAGLSISNSKIGHLVDSLSGRMPRGA